MLITNQKAAKTAMFTAPVNFAAGSTHGTHAGERSLSPGKLDSVRTRYQWRTIQSGGGDMQIGASDDGA